VSLGTYGSVILGSAAVGALVSSLITQLGLWRERHARRQELILSEAVKLGQTQMDTALQVAAAGGKRTAIIPMIEMIGTYHKLLKHLLETDKLGPDYTPVRERYPEDSRD